MKKKINWPAVIMLSISAHSAMAITLVEHFDAAKEKTLVNVGDEHVLIAHDAAGQNTVVEAQTKPLPKQLSKQLLKQLSKQQQATPLARALAQSENQLSADTSNVDKTIILEISELRDNSGLVYLGGKVSAVQLNAYLAQLKSELGAEQYAIYRQHQAARDHQSFHVTLVNPYEYQVVNKEKLKLSAQFRVILHGLGRVEQEDKKSYFIVASSPDGQFIRQKLLLKNKDFHITLGFLPDDIYGVSKGLDTLINK